MLYLSGIHALNIPCQLETGGDWHKSGIRFDVINERLLESDDSVFKDYGIEKNKRIVFLDGQPIYNVANHIRACLDLLAQGKFSTVQGIRNDFIVTDKYDDEIFNKVLLLKSLPHFNQIDAFMSKEYMMKWVNFKSNNKIKKKDSINPLLVEIMMNFLRYLHSKTNKYRLIDDLALNICYGLNIQTDTIYLDCEKKHIIQYIKFYVKENHFKITYDTNHNLKIDCPHISSSFTIKIIKSLNDQLVILNGIQTYSIDLLCYKKVWYYLYKDSLKDLYAITYIYKQYRNQLSHRTLIHISDALTLKGLEYFEYLICTQSFPFINKKELNSAFLFMYHTLID